MIDNPSFETCDDDDESIWKNWMSCADDDFAQDEGTMIVRFRTWSDILEQYPNAVWPDAIGAIPVYIDGWTSIGMSWSAEGGAKMYVNSKRRPWWAVGILWRLWYRWVSR